MLCQSLEIPVCYLNHFIETSKRRVWLGIRILFIKLTNTVVTVFPICILIVAWIDSRASDDIRIKINAKYLIHKGWSISTNAINSLLIDCLHISCFLWTWFRGIKLKSLLQVYFEKLPNCSRLISSEVYNPVVLDAITVSKENRRVTSKNNSIWMKKSSTI